MQIGPQIKNATHINDLMGMRDWIAWVESKIIPWSIKAISIGPGQVVFAGTRI